MVRLGKIRTFINEFAESQKTEKMSFILPFFLIIIDLILMEHAISIRATHIIILTTLLFILSLFEVILVLKEIHLHYYENTFDRVLTIKLDDFIIENKNKNVKKIVEDFIGTHSQYKDYRNKIYHITCQILETHKEEIWERTLTKKLKKFIKRKKKTNVDDILCAFIKKHPSYKKYRATIYQKICQIMDISEK